MMSRYTFTTIASFRAEGEDTIESLGVFCSEPPLIPRDALADRLDQLGAHDQAAAVRMEHPDSKFRLVLDPQPNGQESAS